ncbi:MAG TPA: glycosyltransferase family 4 protein [Humisphaera sp.]
MRILKVANCERSRNSGMGRVMHCTADGLREMGHRVDLWFKGEFGLRSLGRLERLAAPLAVPAAVRRAARAGDAYDVVEVHEPLAAGYCFARLRDRSLPPCAVMSHGVEALAWRHRLAQDRSLGRATSLKSRLLVPPTLLFPSNYALRHADQVMCLNGGDEAFLRTQLGVSADRLTRVTNGVAAKFHLDVDRPARPPRLLCVGTWIDRKGTTLVARAFERVLAEHPDARLSLLGTGAPADAVRADFGPAGRASVNVVPRVDDEQLLDAYREHDVILSASYYESWGLGLTEAAAAGLAPVTTAAPGPAGVFRDGVDALVTPVGDADAFAAAVCRACGDEPLRRRLAAAAAATARQYTWQAAAERNLVAYGRAIAAR